MTRFSDKELIDFRKEFDEHARLEEEWKKELETKLNTLLEERAQIEGGVKLLKLLAAIIAAGAAAWAWIVSHLNVGVK